MKVHYLEIVTLDVESVCATYEKSLNIKFGEPDMLLGGARTGLLSDGSQLGVRAPLRETEAPIVRPYWLVEDIEKAVSNVESIGAEIAMPPLEIPGKGKFAIYILGSSEHGLWQL
jgi:predicted enzyme related to lactoylglutathione lyase